MEAAASLPAAIASTTVLGPVTASPPAKMSGSCVCKVTGSTLTVPQSLKVQAHSSVRQAQSDSWPMAGITVSTSITNSEPGIGSGRRRPLSSGSPSCILTHSMLLTRPFSAMIRTGLVRVMISIPSSRHSSISAGSAGIS